MKLLSATIACALAATAIGAFAAEPISECIDLGATHTVRRAGDDSVAIRDDDRYYLAQKRHGCSDLNYSGRLSISTDEQPARLCPQGSRLTTQQDRCAISRVERIDAQAFKRYTRR